MPHLTLEYTTGLGTAIEFDLLFARIHGVLAEVGGIKKRNCKSRAVERDRFYVGDGDENGFVHLDVRFLEGRSKQLKQEIGRELLAVLLDHYVAVSEAAAPQVTVEISDIVRDAYFKFPEGSLGVDPP